MNPCEQTHGEVVRPPTAVAPGGRVTDMQAFVKGLIDGMRCGVTAVSFGL